MAPALPETKPAQHRALERSGLGGQHLMARALMYLFVAGAAIALLTLAIPNSEDVGTGQVLITSLLSLAIAGTLWRWGEHLALWPYHGFLACGTVMIQWAIYASGGTTSLFAMFYLWIAVYAFYFFPPFQASLQVALIAGAYAVGLVALDESGEQPFLSWLTTTVAVVVAGAMIGVLKHRLDAVMRRLAEAGRADTLTGLSNEQGFNETLELELERARRSGTRVTVMIGALHELSGSHEASSERVLELVGTIVAGEKRRVDGAARLDSSEFALVLPYTDAHGATIMAERLRSALTEALGAHNLRLSVSFGISSFPRNGTTSEVLLQTAREALDSARELGGDRVVIHQTERPSLVQHIEAIPMSADEPPPIPTGAREPRRTPSP